ncbi:hypothetical protein Bca52824_014370 [Brassica carinata]|uniref:Uncharacterized protein n=1 Tax=Brassica carinata TaxID=52824 RepID=A0A8X8B4C9_BRACI|nr:hypothetical protein Bca52824_014370 [Brassica carinata]
MKNTESANQLELMDDFLEMEKLACLPNDENTNGHSSADSDAETLAAMQLKKSISTVLQSLPKDAAMEKILAEVQCAIEDAGGAPFECHGPNKKQRSTLQAVKQILKQPSQNYKKQSNCKIRFEWDLESAHKSNGMAETQLKCMVASYTSFVELSSLNVKIENLEDELHDEKENH